MKEYRTYKLYSRMLAMFLAAVMIFTSIPITAAAAKDEFLITGFSDLSEEVQRQSAAVGTAVEQLQMPEVLEVSDGEENRTIEGITWECIDPENGYDADAPGNYLFIAVLPEGYQVAGGVTEPVISVDVQPEETEEADTAETATEEPAETTAEEELTEEEPAETADSEEVPETQEETEVRKNKRQDSNLFDISEGSITIAAGTNPNTLKVSYGDGQEKDNIPNSSEITLTGTSNKYSVTVNTNANIALENLRITVPEGQTFTPVNITGSAEVAINIVGDNLLDASVSNNKAGLRNAPGATVTIDAADTSHKLTARGFSNGAGIGGEVRESGGKIIINGGTIDASARYNGTTGAAIGSGGYQANTYNVTINGGNVIARGSYVGSAIGGGYANSGGQVTIHGGTVTTTGENRVEHLGGGNSQIIITGGSINADPAKVGQPTNGSERIYLNTLTIGDPAVAAGTALTSISIDGIEDSYGMDDAMTDDSGKVYLWLPQNEQPDASVSVTADGRQYLAQWARNQEAETQTLKIPGKITYMDHEGNDITDTLPAAYADAKTSICGVELIIPEVIPYVRTGAIFDGWYDASEGGNKVTGAAAEESSDLTLYARWTEISSVFDISQGKIVIESEDEYLKVTSGDRDPVLFKPEQLITLTGSSDEYGVTISTNVSITMEDLRITVPSGQSLTPVNITDSAEVAINIVGDNLLDASASNSKAGLRNAPGATVTIDAVDTSHKLTALGYGLGAGIGGETGESGGKIIINGGTIDASARYAGATGAAIGGGYNKDNYNVTINGGNVIARGSYMGSAIGGGFRSSGGQVTIHGGTVTTIGGNQVQHLGGGNSQIIITGGSINADPAKVGQPTNGSERIYLNTLTVGDPAVAAGTALTGSSIDGTDDSYGTDDAVTDDSGKVYLWLPQSDQPDASVSVTADGRQYLAQWARNQETETQTLKIPGKITYMDHEGNDITDTLPAVYADAKTSICGVELIIPEAIPYIRTEAMFDGWYDAGEGGNKITGAAAEESSDLILYARWTEVSSVFDIGQGKIVIEPEDGYLKVTSGNRSPVLFNPEQLITLTGSSYEYGVTISTNVSITMENLRIKVPSGQSLTPVNITDSAEVAINIVGDNLLDASASANRAGLRNAPGATVIIDAADISHKLTAKGNNAGAGIGGLFSESGGNIIINGGTINAETIRGSSVGAAIGGGGYYGNNYNVVINGGNVTAHGSRNASAIGGGLYSSEGQVTIQGGTVTTTGEGGAEHLGMGNSKVIITGGSIHADPAKVGQPTNGTEQVYLNTLTVGNPAVGIGTALIGGSIDGDENSYGINDVGTDGNGRLYLWLPQNDQPDASVSVTADDNTYIAYWQRNQSKETKTLIIPGKVTFKGHQGSDITDQLPVIYDDAKSNIYGLDITIPQEPPYTLEGATFTGWFDQDEGGSKVTSLNSESTDDVTLYARWVDFDPPTGTITVDDTAFTSFEDSDSYNLFYKDSVDVKISGAAQATGIRSIEYICAADKMTKEELESSSDWVPYNNQFTLNAKQNCFIYARIKDRGGNVTIISTDGIVVYTDSQQDTKEISYRTPTAQDMEAAVKLNGNTVAQIKNGNDVLTEGQDYTVDNSSGVITFKKAFLNGLAVGQNVLSIGYHPFGHSFVEEIGNAEPAETSLTIRVMADNRELEKSIEQAKAYKQAEYTDATWRTLTTALTNAESINRNQHASQAQVDNARTALQRAISGLVRKPVRVSSLRLSKTTLTMTKGSRSSLAVTVLPANAANKKVTWSSSNPKVVTVSGNGSLTAVNPGKATITVKAADGSGVSASCQITVNYAKVKKLTVKAEGLATNQKLKTVYLARRQKLKLRVSVSPAQADQKVTYKSRNKKIATISKSGVITAKKAGKTKIEITAGGAKKVITIRVVSKKTAVRSFKVKTKKTLKMKRNQQVTIRTSVSSTRTTDRITYKSSKKSVAAVSKTGVITAKKKGKATITVKCGRKKAVKIKVTVR